MFPDFPGFDFGNIEFGNPVDGFWGWYFTSACPSGLEGSNPCSVFGSIVLRILNIFGPFILKLLPFVIIFAFMGGTVYVAIRLLQRLVTYGITQDGHLGRFSGASFGILDKSAGGWIRQGVSELLDDSPEVRPTRAALRRHINGVYADRGEVTLSRKQLSAGGLYYVYDYKKGRRQLRQVKL